MHSTTSSSTSARMTDSLPFQSKQLQNTLKRMASTSNTYHFISLCLSNVLHRIFTLPSQEAESFVARKSSHVAITIEAHQYSTVVKLHRIKLQH